MDIPKIKERIKEMMTKKNLTYYQLAKMSDLSEVCIRNWYNPKRNYTPSLEAIFNICRALNISCAQLFCDDDEKLMPVSAEDRALISDFKMLNNKEKGVVREVIDVFLLKK